ncbi:MAG: CsbD family protein [Caulobacteraceae bacterium]
MSEDRIEGALRKGLGRAQDAIGGLTGDVETQARGKVNAAAGSIQNAYGQAKDQAQDAFELIQDYVHERPFAALAIGIGVGLVLGMSLLGGRKVVYLTK